MNPAVRRETLRERVSASSGGRLDQGRLWQQVDERLKGSGVVSSTSDYGSYLQTRSGQLWRQREGVDRNAWPGRTLPPRGLGSRGRVRDGLKAGHGS